MSGMARPERLGGFALVVSRVEDEALGSGTRMRGDQGGLVADLHLAGAAVDLHLAADEREGHRVGPALEAHRAVVRHLAADHDVEGTRQRQQLAE